MNTSGIKFSWPFITVFVPFCNILITILKNVTRQNPVPYIDEIFHIPQAQRYCRNEFDTWDDKITTLPGLYLVSIAIIKPLELALGLKLCSVYGLRFINVLGTLLNFILCHAIQQKLSPSNEKKGEFVSVLSALNIAIFPPLFFFTFLYYTDVWSIAFVLLMYLLHLSESPVLASVAGACAVMMRQTNILWVGLVTLDAGWNAIPGSKKEKVNSLSGIFQHIFNNLTWKSVDQVLRATFPYVAICSFFLTFVIVNQGIVVGDRKAHSVVIHPMQNLYFLDSSAFFALPFAVFELKDLLKNRPSIPSLCTLWLLAAVLTEYNLLEHPYLLADNRHLAFYIWRRVFGHRVLRRILTVTYVISGLLLLRLLRRMSYVFLVWFAFCTILNLTPQYLFEIRYFIIPFILARVHFPQSTKSVLIESAFFAVINAAVFYTFFTKEFIWTSEPDVVQRIIW